MKKGAFFLHKDLFFAQMCERSFGGMPKGEAESEGTSKLQNTVKKLC